MNIYIGIATGGGGGEKNKLFLLKKNNSTPSPSICFWCWWFHLIGFHLQLKSTISPFFVTMSLDLSYVRLLAGVRYLSVQCVLCIRFCPTCTIISILCLWFVMIDFQVHPGIYSVGSITYLFTLAFQAESAILGEIGWTESILYENVFWKRCHFGTIFQINCKITYKTYSTFIY